MQVNMHGQVCLHKPIHMSRMGKELSIHHPITYVSGLFKGPQLNWAALTKEAYAIYMVARKLDCYLREAETTIRSDHLPLKNIPT